MKIVILAPQCAGKTTLKKYLQSQGSDLPLVEEDELFVQLNKGAYPKDLKYKEDVLRPQLEDQVLSADNMVFLTSYGTVDFFERLKKVGFQIVRFDLSVDEFHKRNAKRIAEEGYDDASEWVEGIYRFHNEIQEAGLVDLVINAEQTISTIAMDLLTFIQISKKKLNNCG